MVADLGFSGEGEVDLVKSSIAKDRQRKTYKKETSGKVSRCWRWRSRGGSGWQLGFDPGLTHNHAHNANHGLVLILSVIKRS